MKSKPIRKRTVIVDGQPLTFDFVYYPGYQGDRINPPDDAEIELLSITDEKGNSIPIPDCDPDDEKYNQYVNALFRDLSESN